MSTATVVIETFAALRERAREAVVVYPGEDELAALAEGALRVLRGEERARVLEAAAAPVPAP